MILVTGGTGTIGTGFLLSQDNKAGYLVLTRKDTSILAGEINAIRWNPPHIPQELSNYDIEGVIHLAGYPVWRIFSPFYFKKMRQSRIDTILAIANFFRKQGRKLKFLIGMSSIAIYHRWGYLKKLTEKWEMAYHHLTDVFENITLLRTGIVISPYGGFVPLLVRYASSFRIVPVPYSKTFYWIDWTSLNRIIENSLNYPGGKIVFVNCFHRNPQSFPEAVRKILMFAAVRALVLAVVPSPSYSIDWGNVRSIEDFTPQFPTFNETLNKLFIMKNESR